MKKSLLFLLFTLSLFSATARIFSVNATLNGANMVPANATTAAGTLTGTFDDVTGLLNYTIAHNVQLSELSENFGYGVGTGAAGANSGVFQIDYATTNPFSNSINVPDITNLLAGNNYVIVLNEDESSMIRGQLIIGIEIFNFAARHAFYGLGGYSFTQNAFPNGVQADPYIVSGPSPLNDFSHSVSATGGIKNSLTAISTNITNTPILIQFNGNNVRKFSCQPVALNELGILLNDDISFTATTNLGNIATQTGGFFSGAFVGFSVTGENEYLISITASFPTTPSPAAFITIGGIMVGDNTPKNVALNFDGVNDYVETNANVGNFDTNQDFTVSCWIKPDPIQTTQSGQTPYENDIISKWAGLGAMANNNYPFVIRYLNQFHPDINQRGKILVGQWDGAIFQTIISNTAVDDGKWHHVAFVREGGAGADIFKLYIDGVLEGTNTTNVPGITNNTTPLQFGRRGNNQSYFKGEIDEVRIWNIAKTDVQIDDERFCKNPDPMDLQASYSFSNGVPHDNNPLIFQIQDAVGTNHGTLTNFAKTGDASNFVTGQVKYVKKDATGSNNSSSWANAYTDLQSALSASACNDLFEVYVAKGTTAYTPHTSNLNTSFNIPTGMRLYGGFAGTEKSINQRNMALIHSTNKTTLSGDLNGNDTQFVFTTNRTDNSNYPVDINGNNVVFDGFTVSGSSVTGGGIGTDGTNVTIKNSRVIDNTNLGLYIFGGNATIANCSIMGNKSDGIYIGNSSASINECLIANNGLGGVFIFVTTGTRQTTITNSTIASNADYGISVFTSGGTSTNTLKNSLIYGNASGGISNDNFGGTITNTITYSLVQGVTTGTGNLNGNTVNPQFVSPLANTVVNITGDYRLKDSSPCINVGDDAGVSPLDLDRNPRPKGGKTDMGAYESNVNMNEIISIATGNWENNSTWNLNRVPLATDKVILNTPFSVTVTTNTAKAKIIEQKPSSDLKFNAGGSLELKQ